MPSPPPSLSTLPRHTPPSHPCLSPPPLSTLPRHPLPFHPPLSTPSPQKPLPLPSPLSPFNDEILQPKSTTSTCTVVVPCGGVVHLGPINTQTPAETCCIVKVLLAWSPLKLKLFILDV